MKQRNNGPRNQLNLNIPNRLHAEMEATRLALGVQFKQDYLCKAIAISNALKEPLRQFLSLPVAMDCGNDQKFASAFLEWMGIPASAKNKTHRTHPEGSDATYDIAIPYTTESLSSVAGKLNEILGEIRAHIDSGKNSLAQDTIHSQEESHSSSVRSGRAATQDGFPSEKDATGAEDDVIGPVDGAISRSVEARRRVEGTIRSFSEFVRDIERECATDKTPEKRTA